MASIGRINCYEHKPAPKGWKFDKYVGINRLYYIHGGTGGYRHNGKEIPFIKDRLYFIPYSADFEPFCDPDDPILHTYADFELIPPVLTDEILIVGIEEDEMASAALSVFVAGGKRLCNKTFRTSEFFSDSAFRTLCSECILYLVDYITKKSNRQPINDEMIAFALEQIHTRLSEPLSVKELARACYLTEEAFIRRFKKRIGTTPYAYLKELRRRTAICLHEAGMSHAQIAEEVGYSDASSLLHALASQKRDCF